MTQKAKMTLVEQLQGKKTYIMAGLIGIVTVAKYLQWIDDETANTLLGLLGAGTVATVAAKVNRVEDKL